MNRTGPDVLDDDRDFDVGAQRLLEGVATERGAVHNAGRQVVAQSLRVGGACQNEIQEPAQEPECTGKAGFPVVRSRMTSGMR